MAEAADLALLVEVITGDFHTTDGEHGAVRTAGKSGLKGCQRKNRLGLLGAGLGQKRGMRKAELKGRITTRWRGQLAP